MAKNYVRKYPYLAKYKTTTEWNGIILLMLEPHRGVAVYIPQSLPAGDARLEAYLGQQFMPANAEIADYTGAVTLQSETDPTAT